MRDNYRYRGVRGMHDVFPEAAEAFRRVEQTAAELFHCFGYGEIRTPLVEQAALFERGVGQGTDIVSKEMFFVTAKGQADSGPDENDHPLVLRPEATAAVARAYVENERDKSQAGTQRYYYMGPMFRHERPQRGRLRQFTQIGIELMGCALPWADAEAVLVLHDVLAALGVSAFILQINSVGCPQCRPAFVERIRAYAREHSAQFCADCHARIEKNPLRLFDCKRPNCQAVMGQAPNIQNHLCPDCLGHQAELLRILESAGVASQLTPGLVRGLDYYTRTVFEAVSGHLGAQNAIAAGGRYDHLIQELEGPSTPAVGWSLGLERLLEILPAQPSRMSPDVFVVAAGPEPTQTWLQVLGLRRQGFKIRLEYGERGVKALLKRANREGARFSLFVADDDPGRLEIKNMLTGEQQTTTWDKLPEHLAREAHDAANRLP